MPHCGDNRRAVDLGIRDGARVSVQSNGEKGGRAVAGDEGL